LWLFSDEGVHLFMHFKNESIVTIVRDIYHNKEEMQEDTRRAGSSPFLQETGYQPKRKKEEEEEDEGMSGG
jgi:hypothetical protein